MSPPLDGVKGKKIPRKPLREYQKVEGREKKRGGLAYFGGQKDLSNSDRSIKGRGRWHKSSDREGGKGKKFA